MPKKEEKTVVVGKKEMPAPVATRDLEDLMASQMTRDEMLAYLKDKKVEVPKEASNDELRKAIRVYRDNGKKVGPTL
jgi:hypothetical protein